MPAPTKPIPVHKKFATALAAAVLIGSPLGSGVATADEAPATIDSVLSDYLAEYGAGSLESIMTDDTGAITIRSAEPEVAGFAAAHPGVNAEVTEGPAASLSTTEVTSGDGYLIETPAGLAGCSVGFPGFNPVGEAAIITAGHCTDDGRNTNVLTGDASAPLGTFGFSQFGAPGNTAGWTSSGTDVAVIDGINPALSQRAQATNIGQPIVGQPICMDGAQTGHTCATVSGIGIFTSMGSNYSTDPGDIRIVNGFYSDGLAAAPGDSGGSIMAGTTAVGVVSSIGGGATYGVSVREALTHTDGYTVKIALNAPEITSVGPFIRSAEFGGVVEAAPAGTTVRVTINGHIQEVPVGPDGSWTASAPATLGVFDISAQTKNGFSASETSRATLEVSDGIGIEQPVEPEPIIPPPVQTPPGLNVGGTFGGYVPPIEPAAVEPVEVPVAELIAEEPASEEMPAEKPELIVTAAEPPAPRDLPQPQAGIGAGTSGTAGIIAGFLALTSGLIVAARQLRRS